MTLAQQKSEAFASASAARFGKLRAQLTGWGDCNHRLDQGAGVNGEMRVSILKSFIEPS